MNDDLAPDDPAPGTARGWGYGLAAWILAAYTAGGDVVLDLDADPGIRIAAETMRRAYLTGVALSSEGAAARPAPGALTGVRLAVAAWPRPEPSDGASPETAVMAEVAAVLVPGAWLALVVPYPVPNLPLTIHTGPLLDAASAAGLEHPRAVHATAADPAEGTGRTYRCAVVFRRAELQAHQIARSAAGDRGETRDG